MAECHRREKLATTTTYPRGYFYVYDGLNQAKGAKGPTEWMPPNHSFRCEYLTLWQDVLTKYQNLKMTNSEKRIFMRQLDACKS